jgi:hypothetical protein
MTTMRMGGRLPSGACPSLGGETTLERVLQKRNPVLRPNALRFLEFARFPGG